MAQTNFWQQIFNQEKEWNTGEVIGTALQVPGEALDSLDRAVRIPGTKWSVYDARHAVIDPMVNRANVLDPTGVAGTVTNLAAEILIPDSTFYFGKLVKGISKASKAIRGADLAFETAGAVSKTSKASDVSRSSNVLQVSSDPLIQEATQARKTLLKPRPRGTKLSSKEAAQEFYGLDVEAAKELGFVYKNKGKTVDPNWGLSPIKLRGRQLAVRNQRIAELTDPDMLLKGNAKAKTINAKGMDPHHITPIHVSAKIKKGMSKKAWNKLVKEDAKLGIYHGNHPRNLVAARHSTRTPTHSAGKTSEIYHRSGPPGSNVKGYHELEAEIKSIKDYHQYRDLMMNQMRARRINSMQINQF